MAAAAAPAAAGAPQRQMLQKRRHTRSVSLLQKDAFPSRRQHDLDEEPEHRPGSRKHKKEEVLEETKTVDEMREDEGSLQAERQSVGGMSALKLNHTAGNHSDDKTSRGSQPVSPLQLSSRGPASDANSTTASVASPFPPFPANGSWPFPFLHSKRTGLGLQLRALLHSRFVPALASVAAASPRADGAASWLLAAAVAVFVVALVLALVCLGRRGTGGSANADGIQPPWARAATPGGAASRLQHPMTPSLSAGPASARALPKSQQSLALLPGRGSVTSVTENYLCPYLVVPQTCEASLYVPISLQSSFHVTDGEGNQVLKVELQVGLHEQRRVQLMSNDGFLPLAQCVPHSSVSEFRFERGSGEHFAKFYQAWPDQLASRSGHEPKWIVRTVAGDEWAFHGQFDKYSVEVTDKFGRMLAIARREEQVDGQPSDAGNICEVRVAPLMDVSIVLLGLFAVNNLM